MEFSCSIRGCNSEKGSLLFKFPNPERHHKLFMEWVGATGDESLLNCHPLEIYYSMRVCQFHFEEKDYKDNSTMPVPYLNLPEPVKVPSTWIISIRKSEDIDEEHMASETTYLESDIIETAGFVKYTYTTVNLKKWFNLKNMFLVAKVDLDGEEGKENDSSLWSVPRTTFMEPDNRKNEGGSLNNINKSVHYILTSPSEYYSTKFEYLVQMHNKSSTENKKLWKENRTLKKKVRELKKLLLMKHI